ncbi:MAG: hypothetical protein LUG16_07665 [Candidatus Gastranaerophilales bacterium]|nr:hypothetical protein [Candidatus Gastranaerophilales bacterium]
MPEFSQPFNGNKCSAILDNNELIRAVRFSIAAEFEAIQLYEQLRDSIDDEHAKKLLNEVAGDEKEHVGNFLHLLKILSPEEEHYYKDGWNEASQVMNVN